MFNSSEREGLSRKFYRHASEAGREEIYFD